MNIENKSKRRPAGGERFETKDAYTEEKTGWATTDEEWEGRGLTKQTRADAAKAADKGTGEKEKFEERVRFHLSALRMGKRIADKIHDIQSDGKIDGLVRSGVIDAANAENYKRQLRRSGR